ncbi:MAG TPA: hypothetical protein VMU32_03805 [Solirubrobacteraceae bacterium]|nr:hypothetical protein [Solirubrobacteraceae bacterium]
MRWAGVSVLAAVVATMMSALCASSACAARPWWHLALGSRPSALVRGSEAELVVSAENLGDAATDAAAPVRIVDVLPAGLEAVGVAGVQPKPAGTSTETVGLSCAPEAVSRVSCESSVALVPFDSLEVRIKVRVLSTAAETGENNEVSITGGEAPSAHVSRALAISAHEQPASFGVEEYELTPEEEGGGLDTQAASHSFQVTGTIALDQGPDAAPLSAAPLVGPAVAAKDLVARLPAGLVADPGAVARCAEWIFLFSDGLGNEVECPEQAAVGVASVTARSPGGAGTFTVAVPIFNVEPEPGEPARFGFFVPFAHVPVLLDTSVRSGPGEDWGVDLSTSALPQDSGLISARVTFWGAPDARAHENSRGWGCMEATRGSEEFSYEPCLLLPGETNPPALLRLPTSCSGALQSSLQAESWAGGAVQSFAPTEALSALGGCGAVAFTPTVSTVPTTQSASSPSGLAFDLNFNSEGLLDAGMLAQSDLKNTVVTLPQEMTIDPSAGVGLGACTRAQYAEASLSSASGAGCPADSKLGTVEIETPLLFTTVYGSLYLAQPYENPFSEPGHPDGSLIALYVVARSRAERGILVKLAGKVTPNPVTGQLTISFEGDPQLPFAHFNFHFREGQQAPLITPATCGTYTTQAALTPFSEPAAALQDTASFQITSGSEGAACPTGPLPPFTPHITSQTLNDHAGVFSPLSVELTRSDADSEIASYSTVLPPGLTADLSGIPFCPEADIEAARRVTGVQEEAEPSCPATSEIGHTLVGTGVGSVLDYVPGTIYFAGPFHGDPFSVVSITSATVGPFDLGTIVIRFGLQINPYTAQVSITPTGSEPIPTIIDGIVTHVRDIRVSIDRTAFTLNPTTCNPLPVSSTLTSSVGQSATISAPFQSTDCNELQFKPKFVASTQARTSRADGASISVKLNLPTSTLGSDSNIKTVKVELPKALPSRLATLQKACTEAQFNTNPAGCPSASMIGYANANTPILPVPLAGPVIFVSHGGEAFPSLVMVLQGYGITIDLVGATYISPKGITSTTFKTIPDEPVGDFQLTLPEGRYSALAAIGNLCHTTKTITVRKHVAIKIHGHKRKVTRKVKKTVYGLLMPTEFVAQNGTVRRQDTPIAVTGCPRARTKAKQAKKRKRRHHK